MDSCWPAGDRCRDRSPGSNYRRQPSCAPTLDQPPARAPPYHPGAAGASLNSSTSLLMSSAREAWPAPAENQFDARGIDFWVLALLVDITSEHVGGRVVGAQKLRCAALVVRAGDADQFPHGGRRFLSVPSSCCTWHGRYGARYFHRPAREGGGPLVLRPCLVVVGFLQMRRAVNLSGA